MSPTPVTVLGWREWIRIPDWGVEHLKAKVDTGARTSALHVSDFEEFEHDTASWCRFVVHPWQQNDRDGVLVTAPLVEWRAVRSSSGQSDIRPVVTTTVSMGGLFLPIELTLTRRDDMKFRMLIGRAALQHHCLVDPAHSYLGGIPKKSVRRANRRKP